MLQTSQSMPSLRDRPQSTPSLRDQLVAASAPGSPASGGKALAKLGLTSSSMAKPGTAPLPATKPGSALCKKRFPQFHQSQFYTKPFDTAYEELSKARNLRKLEVLFVRADADGSGEMSLDEFRLALRCPDIQRAFSVLGVQPHQSVPIFTKLDKRHNGEISISDFMTGLTELVGTDIDGTGKELDIETLRPAYKAKIKYHSHYQKMWNKPLSKTEWRPAAAPRRKCEPSAETLDLGPVHLLPKVKVQRAFVQSASARALHAATASRCSLMT